MSESRSIFITGAAGGIGRACARRFAAAGWFVGLFDIDGPGLASSVSELGLGASCCHAVLDVREPGSIAAALELFAARTDGRMHVLLNNAAVMHVGWFEQLEPADVRRMIAVNVAGVIELAHAGFPLLRATPGSRLINLSSIAAIYGVPEMAVYSATKHAVRGLTEALELEWAAHGVHVCDVMPAFVDTGLLTGTKRLAAESKLGVRLTAEDVAEVVWAAAQARRPRTHWPVGWQAKLALRLDGLIPAALAKLVLRWMAGR
jgi:NAD(P)-dependent dehydrogenase (short-subunit alcohol dehydrogenase family)